MAARSLDRLAGLSAAGKQPIAQQPPSQAPQSPNAPYRPVAVCLVQVPCSWGAMFLGSMWRDFLRFYHLRVRKPFFDFAQVTALRALTAPHPHSPLTAQPSS